MRQVLFGLSALLVMALCGPANAGSFVPLPKVDGKANSLKIRFVKYTGGSSGRMIVELRNGGKRAQKFDPRGLYFVPKGDPDKAPQRLGAAGSFEVRQGQQWQSKTSVTIAPGASTKLKLQVFCLDSHRSSPGAGQGFSVAVKRLPKALRAKISTGAAGLLRKHRGKQAAANSETQSHVWSTRNKKWIKLQGERANEQAGKGSLRRNQLQRQQLNVMPQQVQQRRVIR